MNRATGPVIPPTKVANAIAGHVALDFCNTVGEHLSSSPAELMSDWELFVRWAVQTGLIGTGSYRELVQHPASMHKLWELRETIYRCALALTRNAAVPETDLDALQTLAKAAKPPIKVLQGGALHWWPDADSALTQLGSLLASEALSLFCSAEAARIGVCDGGACGWLFVDLSRGKRRRWCDMKDCGNRAKARRHYASSLASADQ